MFLDFGISGGKFIRIFFSVLFCFCFGRNWGSELSFKHTYNRISNMTQLCCTFIDALILVIFQFKLWYIFFIFWYVSYKCFSFSYVLTVLFSFKLLIWSPYYILFTLVYLWFVLLLCFNLILSTAIMILTKSFCQPLHISDLTYNDNPWILSFQAHLNRQKSVLTWNILLKQQC